MQSIYEYFLIILSTKNSDIYRLKYIKEDDIDEFMKLKIENNILIDSYVDCDENIYNYFNNSTIVSISEINDFLSIFHDPEFVKERVININLDREFPTPNK